MHGSSRVTSAPVPQIHQSLCDTALISEPRPLQDLSPSELEKLVSAVIMDDSFTDIVMYPGLYVAFADPRFADDYSGLAVAN
jgi:hypothetical protein